MHRIAAHYVVLRPVRLTPERARFSYPLAWLAQPALTPARWRSFVRGHTGTAKRGIMSIEDSRDQAHALYSYAIDRDLALARLLRIRLYAVSSFPGLDVYGALVHSFQAIAQQGECQRVVIDLSECANKGVLSRSFIEQSGFERLGENYVKAI